jgi:hypothetical protein
VGTGAATDARLEVIDVSLHGFLAHAEQPLPEGTRGDVWVELGSGRSTKEEAVVVRQVTTTAGTFYGFRIDMPGPTWRACIRDLEMGNPAPGEQRREPTDLSPIEDWSIHDIVAA